MNYILSLIKVIDIRRISFREDINGLRAVAVLSVVLYHAGFNQFKGGWLGVDIFFVISGYLISNIIISEFNSKNFTFKKFYLNRIRRILPALLTTLIGSTVLANLLLTPKAAKEFAESGVASLFFFANYYLQNLDFYNSEPAKYLPLLHTWSLAIEEQFYLFFPVFALLIYRVTKKYFFLILFLASVYSIYLNTIAESFNKFYQIQFRAWELLLGVLVMILRSNFTIKHLEKIGIIFLIFPIYYFDDLKWINDTEPKLIALFGTCLILFSNTETTVLSKLLSVKYLRIIGLSSYSIYLIHQPLFSFYQSFIFDNSYNYYLNNDLSLIKVIGIEDSIIKFLSNYDFRFFLILITVLFGIFSYKYVEEKFIKKVYDLRILFILFLTTLSFLSITKYNNNFSDKLVTSDYEIGDFKDLDFTNIFLEYENIVVVGDSHMGRMYETLNLISNQNVRDKLVDLNCSGCYFVKNLEIGSENNIYKPRNSFQSIENDIKNYKNSLILYGGILPIYIEQDNFFNGYVVNNKRSYIPFIKKSGNEYDLLSNNELIDYMRESFRFLEKNNNDLIVFYPIPEVGWDIRDIKRLENFQELIFSYDYKWFQKRNFNSYRILDEAISDEYLKIYPEKIFCNTFLKDKCVATYYEEVFYSDYDHLNNYGNILLLKELFGLLSKENNFSK